MGVLVAAGGHLGEQLGLDLLGLFEGGPAGAGDLPADPALTAGERVTSRVDHDLSALASLPDHGASDTRWSVAEGERLTWD